MNNYVNNTSWTPAITFGGGNTGLTYFSQTGNYMRIGNCIFFLFFININAKGSSTGNMLVTGLPFNVTTGGPFNMAYSNVTLSAGNTEMYANYTAAATTLTIYQTGSGNAISNVTNTQMANNSIVQGSGFYFI